MGERTDELDAVDPAMSGYTAASAQYTGTFSGEGYADDTIGTYGQADGPADDTNIEIEQTRAEIEQTRAEMSGTIDAIQEKLSPSHIADSAKQTVRDATIGKAQDMVSNAGESAKGFGSTIVETIRQNPVPAALAGIGLGWLIMSGRKQDSGGTNMSGYRSYDYGRNYGYTRDYTYGQGYYGQNYQGGDSGGFVGQARDTLGNVTGRATDTVGNVAGQVTDTAGNVASQVADTAGTVAGQVQDAAGQTLSAAGDFAGQAGEQLQYGARRAQSGFQQMMSSNPMAVGAGAVALGIAVGLSIPETEKENEVMGPVRDQLMDQAQQTVQETTQKVQSVAQEAVGAAKDAAQSAAQDQGLTGQEDSQQ